MSAGFDACNLNALLDFVGSATHSPSVEANFQAKSQATDKSVSQVCGNAQPNVESCAIVDEAAEANEFADEVVSGGDEPQLAVVKLPENLQRVGEAREQQGFSLRTIARRTGIDLRSLRAHEIPTTDMKLSELRAWQFALEVPLVDLIEDDAQPLSSPVKDRASMVRIMKTVVAIKEAGGSPRIQRLAEMLFEQMVELMPELKEIGGWPQHGSRRASGSSRIVEQQINTRSLRLDHLD